jgi:hypothetical protein
VYWQALRPILGGFEGGPVRSFVVRSAVSASLRVPARVYAGYLGVFSVRSSAALSGARVLLQRKAGRRWRTVTQEPFRQGTTELFAALAAGRQTVRAVIVAGGRSFAAGSRRLTVRRGGRRTTSARDDGRFRARGGSSKGALSFRVTGGGRTLRGLDATVTQFCVGPTVETNRVSIGVAKLRSAPIAPDGSVVGVLKAGRGARVVLVGRLRARRLTGTLSLAFSTCAGTRRLDAVRAG